MGPANDILSGCDYNKLFNQLVRKCKERNYFFGDHEKICDLVQDGVEKHIAYGKVIPNEYELKLWLMRIIHNTYLNSLKKRKPVSVRIPEEHQDYVYDLHHHNDSYLSQNFIDDDLKNFLDKLTYKQKLIVSLLADGNNFNEIEEITGINRTTCRTTAFRISKKARVELKEKAELATGSRGFGCSR